MRESWTDARLDDLNRKVDEGFKRVDADLRALNDRFDALQRTMILSNAGIVAAVIGLIATQI